MIRELRPLELAGHEPSVAAGDNHPMRLMTRRAAGLAGEPWDDDARRLVGVLFDDLAGDWHTRETPQRHAVVADALERGVGAGSGGLAVEIGSGIGTYTPMLAKRWDRVVAIDVAIGMLRRAPAAPGSRVQADASVLPLHDGRADAVVLVNAFLFPAEVDRVLAPGGVVVWVNSSGEATPIHLAVDEVAAALPGEWEGVQARAGIGLWCALRRTIPR